MKRWQKLTGFAICAGVVAYALHLQPLQAAMIVTGGLVPAFIAFVTGNVKEHRARMASEAKPEEKP